MALLNKSAILGAQDLKSEEVEVPQWGGAVRVRTMTGLERDEFRAFMESEGLVPVGRFAAAVLASTIVGEDGERLFTMDDIAVLQAKSAASLDMPAAVAMRLNGLGFKFQEDAVKNSDSGQSEDSGSA